MEKILACILFTSLPVFAVDWTIGQAELTTKAVSEQKDKPLTMLLFQKELEQAKNPEEVLKIAQAQLKANSQTAVNTLSTTVKFLQAQGWEENAADLTSQATSLYPQVANDFLYHAILALGEKQSPTASKIFEKLLQSTQGEVADQGSLLQVALRATKPNPEATAQINTVAIKYGIEVQP